MTTYHAEMISCEGQFFVAEVEANSRQDAEEYFEEQWEDATIEGVYTSAEIEEQEAERYRRLEARYDNDTYDLY